MKRIFKYIAILAALGTGLMTTGCLNDKELVESIEYTRCLSPLNLSVKIVEGDNVTFRWDAVKGADQYQLEVYSKKSMEEDSRVDIGGELYSVEELPVTVKLEADKSYWFRVRAIDSEGKLMESKWSVYEKAVNTYAVKPTVYPAVADRTATSITVSWDAEAAASEVDSVKWCVLGAETQTSRPLTTEEVSAAKATVTGLEPFTNYVVSVYYKSANRGDLSIWTRSNTDGYTEIATVEALQQALKDGGKFTLKMDGSPYVVGASDLAAGIEIVGEESVDGSQPVIQGEFHVLSTVPAGASFIFKSVELNGNKEEFGFAWQLKNGGAGKDQVFDKIQFISCKITGYSKGLSYEWGGTFKADELTWDGCTIVEINKANTQGGDGIDFRGATEIANLNIVNNTIYNGFRTFFRIDAPTVLGNVKINSNTFMNLSRDDSSTNNNGILGVKSKPGSFEFKNNLILYMDGNAKLNGPAAANLSTSDLGISFASNYFHGITAANFFNEKTSQADAIAGGGKMLDVDPCFKAKAGIFNISDSDIINAKVGAPKWLMAYNKKPEDLTMTVVEGTHNWDFTNPLYFLGSVDEKMVRDQLYMAVIDNKLNVSDDGIMQFLVPTTVNRTKMPLDGYLAFLVDKPGSVYVKPVNINEQFGNHIIIGKGDAEGKAISIKGGAAANTDNDAPAKIVVRDITEPSLIYVYATGQIGLEQLGWAYDTTPVNTALAAPAPTAGPASVTSGEPKEILVSWEPVENASSYSVEFSGKTYAVEETSYTITESVVGMLDPGSYKVLVYANPGESDIYNTMSEAGVATFAVQPAGGSEGGSEFVVSSVEELMTAIDAGKQSITLKYSDTPYEIGAYTVTTPLHLYGQTEGGRKTPIVASFTLSGEIGGSFTLNNLDITNETVSVVIEDKTAAPVADTVAVIGCNIHGTKALYDNSGKAASCVQILRVRDNIISDCSNGADFIDLRAGEHHTVTIVNNTFANSCRTFIRTDAGHELNYLTVRNNTFYKVATNSSSKDNNGIFHVRSAAGAGLLEYKVINNLFYSILIDETPGHANGFPKFRSGSGIDPVTVVNNYFYNCEDREDKAEYSFWKNFAKEAAIAGGGAVLPADPCKDAANGDFTLINGVAMNANVGDPRWNPVRGSVPSSEVTVKSVEEFLTAISAGKTTITLAAGQYDLTAVAPEVAEVANGKISLVNSLNIIGESGAEFIGGFIFKAGVKGFTAKNVTFNGNSAVDNVFEVGESGVELNKVSINDCYLKNYKNRMFYMNQASGVSSLEFDRCVISGTSGADFTSGDFIDIRKGTVNAVRFHNSTVYNAVRTFLRADASSVINSVLVSNNTFYNMCYVDSKDNNGLFHARSTALDESAYVVKNNIFAGMHRAAETPGNANGYPKLVSTNTASKIPVFSHNYFYDIDAAESGYSFWTKDRLTEEVATAGFGIILSETPFKDAANGDFTLTNALAASERIGDPRWNCNAGWWTPGSTFEVATVDDLIMAIDAGKTNITLTGKTYDLTTVESTSVASGVLSLVNDLVLNGKLSHGSKPVLLGGFKCLSIDGGLVLNNLNMMGTKLNADDSKTVIGNMVEIDKSAVLSKITIKDCDIESYGNRLISGAGESTCGPVLIMGNYVDRFGTNGDFIDFRKGTVSSIKVVRNTFANGIRTFLRADAPVVCGAVTIENNTFYNIGSVDSKDNNGIMHVRSTAATANPRQIVVKKNIFASMHRENEVPSNAAAGFPHLISKASAAIAVPTIEDNIFYDIDDVENYGWWMYLPEGHESAKSVVVTETPFAADPAAGKFTVKSVYKGYGDLRW